MSLKFGDPESIKLRDQGVVLDRLIALNEQLSTGPWQADVIDNIGDNWNVATLGRSSIDDQDYILTTRHVRASELNGDSKTDAEGIAELRNLLPRIIEVLDKGSRERSTSGSK